VVGPSRCNLQECLQDGGWSRSCKLRAATGDTSRCHVVGSLRALEGIFLKDGGCDEVIVAQDWSWIFEMRSVALRA
jgi:hypothetical protein